MASSSSSLDSFSSLDSSSLDSSIYSDLLSSIVHDLSIGCLSASSSSPTDQLEELLEAASRPPLDGAEEVLRRVSEAGSWSGSPPPPPSNTSKRLKLSSSSEPLEGGSLPPAPNADIWSRLPPKDASLFSPSTLSTSSTQTTSLPSPPPSPRPPSSSAAWATKTSLGCPFCGKKTAAAKLAQHLEKCMLSGGRGGGGGRDRGQREVSQAL